MKAVLIIDGTQLSTGSTACLYRGIHDTENEDDIHFHRCLIEQFHRQGWDTLVTLSFTVKEKEE